MKKLISFACSATALQLYLNVMLTKRLLKAPLVGLTTTLDGIMLDTIRVYAELPEHGEIVLEGIRAYLRMLYSIFGQEDLAEVSFTITKEMIEMSKRPGSTFSQVFDSSIARTAEALH